MSVILFSVDLTVVSRVQGAAMALGAELAVVSTPHDLSARVEVQPPSLVIVDLAAPFLDVAAVVQQVRAYCNDTRILAFGPHVHVDKLIAARDAGCDDVLSRGQFFAQMNSILRC